MMARIEMEAHLVVNGDDAEEIKAKAREKIDEFLGGADARQELEDEGVRIEGSVTVYPAEFPLSGYTGEITIDIAYGHHR